METLWAIEPRAFERLLNALRGPNVIEVKAAARDASSAPQIVDGVAVIDIIGALTKYADWFTLLFGGAVYTEIEEQVKQATADDAVRAILLRIDSPGGTVAGVSDVADAVYAAREAKPVIAYISDLGASAGYYIAAQAHRIYSDEDARIGSIGTVSIVDDWSGFYEKAGVKVHVVSTGEHKGNFVRGSEVTDDQLADLQRAVDNPGEIFFSAVARGRGWPLAAVAQIADGRLFVARQEALPMGLIDGIQGFDEVLAMAADGQLSGPEDLAAAAPARAAGEQIDMEAAAAAAETDATETTGTRQETHTMSENQKTEPAAGGVDVDAIKKQAAEGERKRVSAINAALAGEEFTELRGKAIDGDMTVEAAKAAGFDVLQTRLAEATKAHTAELATLQGKADTMAKLLGDRGMSTKDIAGFEASDEQAPEKTAGEGADDGKPETYQARVKALMAEEDKSRAEAMRIAGNELPKSHEAQVALDNEKK